MQRARGNVGRTTPRCLVRVPAVRRDVLDHGVLLSQRPWLRATGMSWWRCRHRCFLIGSPKVWRKVAPGWARRWRALHLPSGRKSPRRPEATVDGAMPGRGRHQQVLQPLRYRRPRRPRSPRSQLQNPSRCRHQLRPAPPPRPKMQGGRMLKRPQKAAAQHRRQQQDHPRKRGAGLLVAAMLGNFPGLRPKLFFNGSRRSREIWMR